MQVSKALEDYYKIVEDNTNLRRETAADAEASIISQQDPADLQV